MVQTGRSLFCNPGDNKTTHNTSNHRMLLFSFYDERSTSDWQQEEEDKIKVTSQFILTGTRYKIAGERMSTISKSLTRSR